MKRAARNWLRLALALAGAAFVIAGALQGDAMDTLAKAATICLECIGIG